VPAPERLFDMTGERVLVTGASRGIGRFAAMTLARHGAAVALAARSPDSVKELAGAIAASGGTASVVGMDVTSPSSIGAGIAQAIGALGGLTVLVNNAGVAIAKPALQQSEGDWDHVLDTNLKGAFFVATECARSMQQHGGGRIVNIASAIADFVVGHLAPYAASKAGLVQLTKAMALEWARHKIQVNAIAPGYITTEMNQEFLESEKGAKLLQRTALRRAGALDDLEGPLLLLSSKACGYMTGSVIRVDGGLGLV